VEWLDKWLPAAQRRDGDALAKDIENWGEGVISPCLSAALVHRGML
jgi:hypothetical protein